MKSIHVISLLATASSASMASDLPREYPSKVNSNDIRGSAKLRGSRHLNNEPHVSETNDSTLVTDTILEGDNLVVQYEGHTTEQNNMVTVLDTADNDAEEDTTELELESEVVKSSGRKEQRRKKFGEAKKEQVVDKALWQITLSEENDEIDPAQIEEEHEEKHAKRVRAKKEHDERVKMEHVKKVHPKKEHTANTDQDETFVVVEELSKKRHGQKMKQAEEEAIEIVGENPEVIEMPFEMSMPTPENTEVEHPMHQANRNKKKQDHAKRQKNQDVEFGISMPQENTEGEHPRHKANRIKKELKKQKKNAERAEADVVQRRRGLKHNGEHVKKQKKHDAEFEMMSIPAEDSVHDDLKKAHVKKVHPKKEMKHEVEFGLSMPLEEVDDSSVEDIMDNDAEEEAVVEQRNKKAGKFEHFKEQLEKAEPVKAERASKGRGGPRGDGLLPTPAPSSGEPLAGISSPTETVSTVTSIASESTIAATDASPVISTLWPTDTSEESLETVDVSVEGIVPGAPAVTHTLFPTTSSTSGYPTWSPTLSPTWMDDIEDVTITATTAVATSAATTTADDITTTAVAEEISISAPTTTTEPGPTQCPPAYDNTKSDYAAGDLVEVLEHTFQCHFGTGIMADLYVPYCNIHEWSDDLLEVNPEAKVLWRDAWVNLGPCEPVLLGEILADEIDGERR